MRKLFTTLFWILLAAGLVIRLLSLSFNGIFDMAVYHEWGLNTLNNGLSEAYQRNYLPFQYQIFELGAYLTIKLKTDYFIVFKSINLLFDCGNLIVLYLLFRKLNISRYYLLLYWLHPWFLLMFSQGYCDVQFTFFILCSLYFTLKATERNYLISGIFLGFAFLMKPQVQIIVLAFFMYGIYVYFKERDTRLLNLFVFPMILFLDYTLYFFVESGNPFRLLKAYVSMGNMVPLTANFLNGWFPISYYLKAPEDPIYAVTDNLDLPNFNLRLTVVLVVLSMIFLFIKRISDNKSFNPANYNLFLIATFSTFIFPFVMTTAHENHLFLGTVLLIPVLAKIKNLPAIISIHVIMLLQFINLYGFYGLGENKYISIINFSYTYEKAFVLSLVAFVSFIVLAVYFLNQRSGFLTQIKQIVKN